MIKRLLFLTFFLQSLFGTAHAAEEAAAPTKPTPLFAFNPPVEISGTHDFPDPKILSDDAASQLKGLCPLAEFRGLPSSDRFIYSFDPWPGKEDNLGKSSYTFNFHLGPQGVTSEKIAFFPTGGGPGSVAEFTRVKDAATGHFALQGIGNLSWSGVAEHVFKFDKPLLAFGVVLDSSADMELRKFYWPAAVEKNGFPISYTLTDGTIVQLGERDIRGSLIKGGTHAFLGVIDRTGHGIVSVSYVLRGLGGNVGQSIGMSHWAFVTLPKPAVASVINLKGSYDFESSDSICPAPSPALTGLSTLADFRFIVANKRHVYRFDTWPATRTDSRVPTGEFSFDLSGKGNIEQKVSIRATNASNNARLAQTSLKSEDSLPYPVLGGLGTIGKEAWTEQTFKLDKPVWAFGVTYRAPQGARLAEATADGKTYPVSYTLSDGTVVHLGNPNTPANMIPKDGKTFVGIIDKTDKGIVSVTVRVQGTAATNQPIFIEDLAFALAGPPPGDWKLVLDENFNGDKLDPATWLTGYTFPDIINNELQGFVPENVVVANGVCTIKVEKRDCLNTDRFGKKGGAQKFASGAFTSYDKFTAIYGYFEARIKMPHARGAGVWPAFWMLPDRGKQYSKYRSDYHTPGYGTGIEADIFEFMPRWKRPDGRFPTHIGCIWSYGPATDADPAPHGYGGYALENNGWGPEELTYPDADTEFHTYGLYWSPERLIWYLDGKPIFRVKDPKHVPDVPHYFLFNISISGNGWGKSPDRSDPTMAQIMEDMPNGMDIDYFRAYSGTLDEAVPAAPTDNPAIVRKYSPPPPDAGSAGLAPSSGPAASPSPMPTGTVPPAPVNSTIFSPSSG